MISASLLLAAAPFWLSDGSVSEPQTTVSPGSYAIFYGEQLALRDRLIQSEVVRLDGGGFVVADLDATLATNLTARGVELTPLPANGPLWMVPARHTTEVDPASVVYRSAEGTLLLSSDSDLRKQLAGHAHCGLQPVPATTLRPTPPLMWRGRVGAGAVAAMTAADPRIQVLVDQVDKANMQATVTSLSANFTRYAESSGAVTAQNDLQAWANALGLATSTQSFGAQYSHNVIAEIPGTVSPEKIVVIGAHYDSVNWQDGTSAISPGADDNASGSSGVLEAARVLSQGGPFEHTLRFVWFSGEELGLLGAYANAQASQQAGQEIIAMINMDMNAYRNPGDTRDVDFATNNTTASLNDFCRAIGALYVPNWADTSGVLTAGSSDHAAYFQTGFPATFFFEDLSEYYQNIHTALDTMALSTTDFDLAQMIVRGVVASAATLAEPVDLAIAHTPLTDSLSGFGPYLATANVTSLTGDTVTAVDFVYSIGGGPDIVLPMTFVGNDTYQVLVPGVGSPVSVAYQIQAFDDVGGMEVAPEGLDERYTFFVGTKNVVFADDFEGPTDNGWTHGQIATQDDWQRGVPQGKAGDPASAAKGTSAWGNDLGISGFNGSYQPNVNNWLRSPSIDASGASGLHLEFERWLTVETAVYDQAQVWVAGQKVWENSAVGDTVDSAWTAQSIDVSAVADGNPNVQIEFRLLSDGGLEFGGWNVDDLRLVEYGPAPLPPVPSFSMSPSAVEAIGGQTITVTGTGLSGVTAVTVDGNSVAFEQGVGELSFVVPMQADLASKAVQVTNVTGSSSASLSILPNAATQLLGPAAAPLGSPVTFTVGAPSGQFAWLLYSAALGATPLPGFVDLSIGSGQTGLIQIGASGALNPAGNRAFALTLPSKPSLSGLTVGAEGLAYDFVQGFTATGAHLFTFL